MSIIFKGKSQKEKLKWATAELKRLYKDRAALWNEKDKLRKYIKKKISIAETGYLSESGESICRNSGIVEGLKDVLKRL